MRVSVVIPAFNAAETIGRALTSVVRQTHAVSEIIVVDDGSTDGTADVARASAGDRLVLVRQGRRGVAAARNAGVARATGEIVALLDADDWWEPPFVAHHVAVFEQHAGIVAWAAAWRWDERMPGGRAAAPFNLSASEWRRPLRGSGESLLRYAFSITASTMAARREALARHPFDEGLVTAEDRDVWIRLVSEGAVWFEPAVLATIAWRADSASQADAARDCRGMLAVLERHSHRVAPSVRRRWEARTYRRWAGRLLAEGRADEAWPPAIERWRREWWNPRAWWILAKCAWRARLQRLGNGLA